MYITNKKSDFEDEEGQKLKHYFKQVFFDQFKKYSGAVQQAKKLAARTAESL